MRQLLYRLIYQPQANFLLRNLNRLLRPLLPGVELPPSGQVSFQIEDKTFRMETNQTSYLTYLLYWKGPLAFEYTPLFIRLISKLRCFYDIGANLGYYSLLAAMYHPSIRVKSFEPAPASLHFLRRNVALNGQEARIRVEALALSDQNGQASFFEVRNPKYPYLKHHIAGESNLTGQSNKGSRRRDADYHPYRVETCTLDAYCAAHPEDCPELMKLDTEGSEHLILGQGLETLRRHKPILICEILFQVIEDKLEDLLKPLGYEFYFHTPAGLRRVETLRRQEDDGVRDCFFVHPERCALIEPFLAS
jgi:FkbM family methyltransferase